MTVSTPPNLFSSCSKLRKVGFAAWGRYRRAEVHETLSSITSRHLSVVSIQLAPSDWSLSGHAWEEFSRWWGDLENALCHLADRRLASGQSPLVLEIVWRRLVTHGGDCGMTHPDTIMPKFKEKGLIRFVESAASGCRRCADILADGSQASSDG